MDATRLRALCKKKHKKLKKHTYVYYMSVCLMSESCQQKKRWQAPGNIKHKNIVTFVVPLQDKLNPTSICFLVPKSYISEILWRFQNIMTLFKGPLSYQKIIGSPSLSILFLPNSNSFPLNSNIPDTQWSKNPFSYPDKDRRKKRYIFYVSGKSPNLPISLLVRVHIALISLAY